jgi:uncharacterized protein YbjQ (UPF0145 family)
MRKLVLILLSSLILSSCGPKVDVLDLSTVDQKILTEASKVQIFKLDNAQPKPEIKEYVGEITAYSCKHLSWDPPASKGDALKQLKVKAVRQGANGVIDITFDARGTDTFGTNCWESVQASGTAVVFK